MKRTTLCDVATLPVAEQRQRRTALLKRLDLRYRQAMKRSDENGNPDPDLGAALDTIEAAGRVLGVLHGPIDRRGR